MKQRYFTQEFKDEAVRLVLSSGRRRVDVADELSIGHSTLDRWLTQARDAALPVVTDGETPEQELKRLRRENAVLRQEREILKKATAFFAGETNR